MDKGLLTEEALGDFLDLSGRNPQKNSRGELKYISVPKGLAKPKTNPMVGRIWKVTQYGFAWGETYEKAVGRNNPDFEIQARNGGFEKVEGSEYLLTRNGRLYMPLVAMNVLDSYIIILDENGNESERFPSNELQNRYGEYFQGSAFTKRESASGTSTITLMVDRMIYVHAGGNTWDNPNNEFANLNLNIS